MYSSIPHLNPEQQLATQAPTSPLLIVAGAGTGKTRTLTSRIVHLIENGISPERICAITFTNKAAQEMAERIGMRDGERGIRPYIGTFHSLGARILRRECRIFGREPNFVIFDDHDSFDLIKKTARAVLSSKKTGASTAETSAAGRKKKKEAPALFARKISELKNSEAQQIEAKLDKSKLDEKKKEEVRRVVGAYENALRQNNAFDFDDLIEKPVAMFKSYPEILKKYQDKFDAVLVDEYQDINPKQYEFVKLLASGHRNLTVVGDDEQTIYTWRYADIKIFLDFDKDWSGAGVYFLEENYRSTGNIIRGATAVVQNNRFRTPKKLWTKSEDGDPILIYEAQGENDEAAWMAREIFNLQFSISKQASTSKQPLASSENSGEAPTVAILYRTNAQSRAIEQALVRLNIPYKIFGGLKFYERREVKDAVAALRYAANTKDQLARERLEKNLSKRKFAEFRDATLHIAEPKPTDVIKIFLQTFGYFDYLEENFINANEREENIAELINFASEFNNLPEFLERLSLLQATDDEAIGERKIESGEERRGGRQPIHLSTIHLAKGLEFDNVFIAGAAEGLLPHIRSIENEQSLEEERRLMYVGMTRAKKKLYISFYGLPSRFIVEIPEECVRLAESEERQDENDQDYKEEYVKF